MYKFQTRDSGILYNALSDYKALCEKCMKNEGLPLCVIQEYNRTIERIDEILEDL